MKRIFTLVLLASTLFLWAQEGEYGTAPGKGKILIAFEKTRFKSALVEGLVEKLEGEGYYLNVVNHQKDGLEGVNPADYDGVFITNSGVTAKVRPVVSEWLAEKGQPAHVLVHTTQRNDWTPAVEVDSITSASFKKQDDIDRLVEEYAALIKGQLP
ncbi:MAG: hypothetical protein PQJ59_11675 [Spirochaetales bacterium]|nr:hypothetical protein [Spirochaetales bacterium]